MKWNLQMNIPEYYGKKNWNRKFLEIVDAAHSPGNNLEASIAKLWATAQVQYVLNTNQDFWKKAVQRVENFDLSLPAEELHNNLEASDPWQLHMADILKVQINGNSYFHAIDSAQESERSQAYAAGREFLAERSQALLNALYIETQKDIAADDGHSKYLHDFGDYVSLCNSMLKKERFVPRSNSSIQTPALNSSVSSVEEFMKKMLLHLSLDWHEKYLLLLDRCCFDIGNQRNSSSRFRGAFTIPAVFGQFPACFVHSLSSFESILGYVHEVGHALHFLSYANEALAFDLPNEKALEVFPIFVELLATNFLKSYSHARNRSAALISAPWLALKFRQMLRKMSSPPLFSEATEIWKNNLAENNIMNFSEIESRLPVDLWLLRKSIWLSDSDLAAYLPGGIFGTLLFLFYMKNSSSGMVEHMQSILCQSPHNCDWTVFVSNHLRISV